MIYSQLPQWNVKNKRVFVRADLNVPLKGSHILNDFRLQSSLKTIDFILNHGGSVVLATHIGRPTHYDPIFSTRLLVPWFKERDYNITFTEDINEVHAMKIVPHQIILLENLRFFPGEKKSDPLFAKQLAHTATLYVNDAFATIHRHDCSVAVVPYEFPQEQRTIGFLLEKELELCETIREETNRPFVTIIGGGKVADKIPLIQGFLDKADTIMICPAICFSFLKASQKPVGISLVDDKAIPLCKRIMDDAYDKQVRLIFPLDYQVADKDISGPLSVVDAHAFPPNATGISIGPKTIKLFEQEIREAGTIFFNGAMGFSDRPETVQATNAILTAMAHAKGTTIIAGGDTVQAAFDLGIADKLDHISTGGGATLAYLINPLLPGLLPFEEK